MNGRRSGAGRDDLGEMRLLLIEVGRFRAVRFFGAGRFEVGRFEASRFFGVGRFGAGRFFGAGFRFLRVLMSSQTQVKRLRRAYPPD